MPSTQVIVNLPAGLAPLCLHAIPSSDSSAPPTLYDLQLLLPTLLPAALLQTSPRLASHTGALLPPTHPLVQSGDVNPHPLILTLTPRLRGGKGGFGSMLRAQGGKMASQKTTNFDSCRDLAGRRLKTVNDARALADYLEHEPARKRRRQEARVEKLEKLAAQDSSTNGARKARFHDPEFEDAHREVMEDVVGAVGRALALEKGENGKGKESVAAAAALSAASAAIAAKPQRGAKAATVPTVGADFSAWDALSDPSDGSEDDDNEDEEEDDKSEDDKGEDDKSEDDKSEDDKSEDDESEDEIWQEEKADEAASNGDSSSSSSDSSGEAHAASVVQAAKKTLKRKTVKK
ncbi:hypothetical protein HDU86_008064 [Geranomyces michiganensis]|nr:hypothetical protein HDU86_008064 [Geranomyces michiganensis]